ncbi:MAG TPA: hypothetical protein VFZ21_21140 [Gemmatimonadaceae bacterium]|nr:hypothetical protein [Gemmatimonadaceae bacterium]
MSYVLAFALGAFVGAFLMKRSAERQIAEYLKTQSWMNRKAGVE